MGWGWGWFACACFCADDWHFLLQCGLCFRVLCCLCCDLGIGPDSILRVLKRIDIIIHFPDPAPSLPFSLLLPPRRSSSSQ